MNFLLTNDDGIDAPGLASLEGVLRELGRVVTLAPHGPFSGCSHQVTTDRPLKITEQRPGRFQLNGTPGDCTRVGVVHLAPQTRWVIAGINAGGNLGVDVHMSGTVAAVREAALLGLPGIALSQYRRGREIDWDRAARWASRVLPLLLERPCEPGTFWNVNFPDCQESDAEPDLVDCHIDPHPLPVCYRESEEGLHYCGRYQDRRREPDHDVDHCFAGKIAVSLLRVDRPPLESAGGSLRSG